MPTETGKYRSRFVHPATFFCRSVQISSNKVVNTCRIIATCLPCMAQSLRFRSGVASCKKKHDGGLVFFVWWTNVTPSPLVTPGGSCVVQDASCAHSSFSPHLSRSAELAIDASSFLSAVICDRIDPLVPVRFSCLWAIVPSLGRIADVLFSDPGGSNGRDPSWRRAEPARFRGQSDRAPFEFRDPERRTVSGPWLHRRSFECDLPYLVSSVRSGHPALPRKLLQISSGLPHALGSFSFELL